MLITFSDYFDFKTIVTRDKEKYFVMIRSIYQDNKYKNKCT